MKIHHFPDGFHYMSYFGRSPDRQTDTIAVPSPITTWVKITNISGHRGKGQHNSWNIF